MTSLDSILPACDRDLFWCINLAERNVYERVEFGGKNEAKTYTYQLVGESVFVTAEHR